MQTPSAEELLAHAAFVRRIAAGLLRDPHDVDDAVQDTYLAALKTPPARGLRAWLAVVARNTALMRLRGERRRLARERAAARPDATAGAADAAARMEVHGRLAEEVLALDEPTRTIIVLRYLDGLKPRAIAARLGIPLDTVRSHLRRGLGRLRGRLDAWRGGDRAAWALVLLPALRDAQTTAILTGAAIMGKKTAAVLIVWAALATGLYVREAARPRASEPRAPEEALAVRPTEAAGARSPAPPLTAMQEMEAFERRWRGSRTGAVRGRLVDQRTQGEPLAAEVRLRFKGSLPDGTMIEYEATTAPDGTFSLPEVRYPLDYEVTCAAEVEGIDSKTSVWIADQDAAVRVGVVREHLLAGEVRDPSGKPIAGAIVFHGMGPGRERAVRTDGSGKYRLALREPLREDAKLRVAAAAPGFRPGRADVEHPAPHLWLARLTLEPGGAVRARLRRRDGTPAEGNRARVIFERRYPKGEVPDAPDAELRDLTWDGVGQEGRGETTVESTSITCLAQADGSVSSWFPFLPSGAWLVVEEGGHRSCHEVPGVAANPNGTFDMGEVTLPEPSLLPMRFVDGAGKPVKGIDMYIDDCEAATLLLRDCGTVKTDDDGYARLRNVTAGRRYRAWGSAAPGVTFMAEAFVAEDGATVTVTRN